MSKALELRLHGHLGMFMVCLWRLSYGQLPEQGPHHRELCVQEKVLKLPEVPLLIQHQRSTVLQFTSLSVNLLSSTASYD
jgi:hypothetical protein